MGAVFLVGAALTALGGVAHADGTQTVGTGAEFATAFQDGTTDQIVLSGNITLPSSLTRPTGADALVIDGAGFTMTAAPNQAMLSSDLDTGPLVIQNLTMTGANPQFGQTGALLWFDADVTIRNSTITGNSSLTATVRLANNSPGDETLDIEQSTFSDNSSVQGAARAEDIVVNGSSFLRNTAGGNAGAIWGTGTAVVSDSVFQGNVAGGNAGAIDASSLQLVRSVVTDNESGSDGGGINGGDGATIVDSTISNNSSANFGRGGGIFVNGPLDVNGSTISGNTANTDSGQGGGIYTNGTTTLVNSTVTGNEASVAGGGVYAYDVVAEYATIVGNTAPDGANIAVGGEGDDSLTAFATVVGLPGGGSNCSGLDSTSSTYGYEQGGATCGLDVSNGADPQLGPLGDNGGTTATLLPSATSPLVDAVATADCAGTPVAVSTDQRGVTRPQGSGCDIGAVERGDEVPVAPVGPTPVTVTPRFTG
jgi:hypothetical protein